MNNIIHIDNLNLPELDIFARLSESQLRHYYEPNGGLFIAESPLVIGRALDSGCEPIAMLVEDKHIETQAKEILARVSDDLPIYTAPFEVLTQLTGFQLTRGALCAMVRPALPSLEELCQQSKRLAILEDVVNPTNVGAIFRSAAALHMDGVVLTAGCSDPLYRRAIRVSMGNVFLIPWTMLNEKKCSWPEDAMNILHKNQYKTVAMALRDDSYSIDAPELQNEEKLAIVLGTEGDGLASKTIASCDYTVKIPMSHGVDSLNVAAASAVAFWELGNHA